MATSPRQKTILYSDFRTDFSIHPVTGDLLMLVNEDAVARSIRNLLETRQYERFFNSKLGSGLLAYLFDNVTPETADLIKDSIERCIQNFEPRAELISVEVSVLDEENAYSARITFSTINRIEPVVIDHLLQLVR